MTVLAERLDHAVIAGIIRPGSKVLDLGCGDGDLLLRLKEEKQADVRGIELNERSIHRCVEKGLSVYHGDIDSGLSAYHAGAFDYVILNQTFQQVKNVDYVIDESLRVGKRVIVGFPNFAHFAARAILFFLGRVPMTPSLPYEWHDTPNLRFLSISDFSKYCAEKGIEVLAARYLGCKAEMRFLPNMIARNALFVITKKRRLPETETTDRT